MKQFLVPYCFENSNAAFNRVDRICENVNIVSVPSNSRTFSRERGRQHKFFRYRIFLSPGQSSQRDLDSLIQVVIDAKVDNPFNKVGAIDFIIEVEVAKTSAVTEVNHGINFMRRCKIR